MSLVLHRRTIGLCRSLGRERPLQPLHVSEPRGHTLDVLDGLGEQTLRGKDLGIFDIAFVQWSESVLLSLGRVGGKVGIDESGGSAERHGLLDERLDGLGSDTISASSFLVAFLFLVLLHLLRPDLGQPLQPLPSDKAHPCSLPPLTLC